MKHFQYILLTVLGLSQVWMAGAQQLKVVQQIEGIPPNVEYRAITHDQTGNIYVATSADVFMIPSNSNKAQPMSAGDQIMDIDWTADDGLILLVKDGTVRFVSSGKILTLDKGIGATCMDVTKTQIWVGTNNGVYTVSIPEEKIIHHYTTANSELLSNEVNFIHMDESNVRWIGTNNGVIRISGKNWKSYEEGQAVTAITSTSEGAWMAADQNMWLVNRFNRWFPIDAWKDLVNGKVKALASDDKGLIYIASDMLVKYDPYNEKIVSMNEEGTPEQHILLAQGPRRDILVAGNDGLSRLVEDTTRIVMPDVKGDELASVVEVLSTPVCNGMSTGRVSVKTVGGQPPYAYKWSYEGATDKEISGLSPGLYQVTITDAAGKSTFASGIVSGSPELSIVATADSKASDKLASDAKASVKISGGVAPFSVQWGNGTSSTEVSNLTEGIHTVRVIDNNGCIATTNITIEADKVLKSLDIATLTLGQTIRVDKLYFLADSATIQPASFAVLEEIYEFLSAHENVIIEVGGHTNSLPEDEYCDRLSTSRAQNIALYLYGRGIPESRITFKGYGKRQPIATNQTVEGRRRNQRVEIKIVNL